MSHDAILFDLDGTLVHMDDAVLKQRMSAVCEQIARMHPAVQPSELMRAHAEASHAFWSQGYTEVLQTASGATDGASIGREIWRTVLRELSCPADLAEIAHDLYWRSRAGVVALYDDTVEVLDHLAGGVPLGVVTNGPADSQLDKLQVHGLDRQFQLFVASGGAGVAKPHPAIYQHALDSLGIEPSRVVHVGDSLTNDVAPAQQLGITAVWLNRTGARLSAGDPEPDYEVSSLLEFMRLLN